MRSNRIGWGLLAPTLVVLGLIGLPPFIYVLYVSFHNWNVFSREAGMVLSGVDNYRRLVFDNEFLGALGRTLAFTAWAVATEFVLGFLLAHVLMRDFKGRGFFRALHALPLMVAPIAVGATWRLLTIPGFGPVPHFLQQWFGVDYNIGRSADHAFWTTVAMDIWHWTPLVTLTLLAGLTTLPKEPFESALVDGASRWQIFRHISLPAILPVCATVVLIRLIEAFKIIDLPNILTNGGPGTATESLSLHAYIRWRTLDLGQSAAVAYTLLFIVTVAAMSYVNLVRRRFTEP